MIQTSRRSTASLFRKTCLSAVIAMSLGATANAQQHSPSTSTTYAVPAGDLVKAINEISRSAGVQIVYDIKLLEGKHSSGLSGTMTLEQALMRALDGSGLNWEWVNDKTISIKRNVASKTHSKGGKKTSSFGNTDDAVSSMDNVVVVGSRLGGSPVESALPIKVISREDIDRSGASSIMQALSYLSEIPINGDEDRMVTGIGGVLAGGNINVTTVQMRGMPYGTTLVLINGRRSGVSTALSASGSFDLSTIPLSLVDRIEVLPAGASSVYGGDALAGVINIVLKKDASGLELRARKDVADAFDASQASIMWGNAWAKGAMTVTATWSKKGALYNSERAITADADFRRFGWADVRSTMGFPATVYSLGGCPVSQWACVVPLDQRDPLPGLDSPVAVVPAGSDGVDLSPEDFLATQGMISKETAPRHLRSPEENYGLHVNSNLQLSTGIEAFAELTYTKRKVPAWQVPFPLYGGVGGPARALVSANHPFNPFGVDVGVDFLYRETRIFASYEQQHQRELLGFRGTLGRFDWEVSGFQAHDESKTGGGQAFDADKIAAALASTDPTTTINPFVSDGSAPASMEVLTSLLSAKIVNDIVSRTSGLNGYVRGSIFRIPAGEITMLIGGETQSTRLDIDSNDWTQMSQKLHGNSTSRAVFAEARIPLVSPRSGQSIERVVMTGALRRESSDLYSGNALTKTVGLEVRPWDSLLLRSSYSTGFRPITVYSISQDPSTIQSAAVDPRFPNETSFFDMLGSGGASPDLVPETSRTVTMGASFRSSENWGVSMTYWKIEFMDQISYISTQALIDNEDLYPKRVQRNPTTGRIELVDGRPINIALRDTAGVDIGFDGVWNTAFGDFYPVLAATYTYRYDRQLTSEAPVRSSLAQYDSAGWAPRWKIVPRLGWEFRDKVSGMLAGRYVNRYKDASPLISGPNAGQYQNLGEFWIVDLNLNLNLGEIFQRSTLLAGTRLTLGATNLLNRMPDFCAGCGLAGYDASQYDIMGRKLYAELKMSF